MSAEFKIKLDGDAPMITDPQATSLTHLSKRIQKDTWYLNRRGEYHHYYEYFLGKSNFYLFIYFFRLFFLVFYDMWQVGGGEPSLKFQLPSSYCLGLKVTWIYGGKGSLNDQLINDEGVCRTAPATPGLLDIAKSKKKLPFLGTANVA